MRLICGICGNYMHFEAEVEMIMPLRVGTDGTYFEQRSELADSAASIRFGLNDLVDYCIQRDVEMLQIGPDGQVTNPYITCARCGSSAVCKPFCKWSPPNEHLLLDDEITQNNREYRWLKKERQKHETHLPVMPREQSLHRAAVGAGHIQNQR